MFEGGLMGLSVHPDPHCTDPLLNFKLSSGTYSFLGSCYDKGNVIPNFGNEEPIAALVAIAECNANHFGRSHDYGIWGRH